ncbi:MAG TPA: hypothetical protein PLU87_05870 [Sedimentisphaerales bacterium]|nr:hypothetical protein [Sedimentisphaerales bacterium]HRS10386.1 hypothetical protein [Sedimentisphaerales bacterium]HRV47091.1 hypothetical protein [Sedimentisphaerales bacterium]
MHTEEQQERRFSTSAAEKSAYGLHSTGQRTRVCCWLIVLSIGSVFLYVCLQWWLVGIIALVALLAFYVPVCLFDDYGPDRGRSQIAGYSRRNRPGIP